MRTLLPIVMMYVAILAGASSARAKDECTHTWTRGKLKSFKQVESEIREKLDGGKIIRIALCHGDGIQYYQVKVLSAAGAIRSVKVSAE